MILTNVVLCCVGCGYLFAVDGSVASNQGQIFSFSDGSRIIFRLSGTGSAGATIRLYLEKYTNEKEELLKETSTVMAPMVKLALELSQLTEFTGRSDPTVIT